MLSNDDRGDYAHLQQSLVAPEGDLPTTTATVRVFVTLSVSKLNMPEDENTKLLLRDFDDVSARECGKRR